MRLNSRVGAGISAMTISARHAPLSASWAAEVAALERAIDRFKTERHVTNNCEVVFFEIVGDEHLHVNVTHRYATKAVSGWAGPGNMPEGFVHNRRFGDTPQDEIIGHLHDMIFAPRI